MRSAVVAVMFGAIVIAVAPVRALDYVSSESLGSPRAGCESCGQQTMQQTMQPPWHRNVRPPSSCWGSRQDCGPAMPCGPSMPCGSQCDPCCEPQTYRMPPCFPRLHALFCGGCLLSPTPPRPPRCPQCGCHIPDGF